MILGLFLTIRMDVPRKDVITQFLLAIPVNATYSNIHWFAEVNTIMLPLCCILVTILDRLVWWHVT